ncbi:aromatic alcohol reductase [Aspergillus foveolatus]|uniref:aromatic alcohol reductase n=1 Tax=Aspergillus foveolatus TaxID=210207 RepID=UPI003CCDD31C
MSSIENILVLGAGELGTEILLSLAQHPALSSKTNISVLLRPSSIASPGPSKAAELERLKAYNITLVPADISTSSQSTLSSLFSAYDTIISATGFSAGRGTQLKLARAVLDARVPRYIPWQFGVDYDTIGRGSAQDLFDEQLDVRDMLRSQDRTKWVIISTGMFTSFLFERAFGVVDADKSVVTALGSWENRVTVTAPADIGRVTAEIAFSESFGDPDNIVYVAGDTVSYGRVADILESVMGRAFDRQLRSVDAAKRDLAQEPENGLFKYQIVFGEGRGVAWNAEETWNAQRGMHLQTAEEWARENLV